MEIVKSYDEVQAVQTTDRVARYRIWSSHLYKWRGYITNRKKAQKEIDAWSQKFFNNKNGNTLAYASGGLYYKDIDSSIRVVEHKPCPCNITGMEYLNIDQPVQVNNIDCMIAANPQSLKYNHSIWDFLHKERETRAGWKPNIFNWLNPGATIFLSFSDWHMYYDRLKLSPAQFVDKQIEELERNSIRCDHVEVERSDRDLVNGNVKLILTKLDTATNNI